MASESSLETVLTRRLLRRLADSRSYERGADYWYKDKVKSLSVYQGRITAKVSGNYLYVVRLWEEGGELAYDCTCPYARNEGVFCKHCVATALTYLDQQKSKAGKSTKTVGKTLLTLEDIENYLRGQTKDRLVKCLMKEIVEEDKLQNEFFWQASSEALPEIRLNTRREVIHRVFVQDWEFLSEQETGISLIQVRWLITELENLRDDEEGAELIEYAVSVAEGALSGFADEADDIWIRLNDLQDKIPSESI